MVQGKFCGAEATAKSLRKMAVYFGAPDLIAKVEEELPLKWRMC
jgi:hypothetical protein